MVLPAAASRLSFPCSCSSASASGEKARAALKLTATATFKTLGLFAVELNMKRVFCRFAARSIVVVALRATRRSRCENPTAALRIAKRLQILLDQIGELRKEIGSIMRTRGGFRMILHTEDRQFLVSHSLHCSVI